MTNLLTRGATSALSAAFLIALAALATPVLAGEYRQSDVDRELKGLTSQDEGTRKSAAFKLSEMGTAAKDAVPVLIEVLQTDPSMSVRGEAASALGKVGAPAEAAVPALIAFLNSDDGGYERTYAASALGDIGKQPQTAVPALINAVKNDREPVVKQLAARALAGFAAQATPSVDVLIDAIKTGDKGLREAASYGLERIPAGEKNVAALTDLLGDEIDSARTAAAKSLGLSGQTAKSAVPALKKLLKDDNSSVREAAETALNGIEPAGKAVQ